MHAESRSVSFLCNILTTNVCLCVFVSKSNTLLCRVLGHLAGGCKDPNLARSLAHAGTDIDFKCFKVCIQRCLHADEFE